MERMFNKFKEKCMSDLRINLNSFEAIAEIIDSILEDYKNKYVSIGAYKQVMWERDIAIKQLHELGYGLGEKIKDGWIPCSKRLPKENGWYECWYMVSCVCNKKEYEPKTFYWEDNLWLYEPNSFRMPTKEYVVAWKPIVPYKSESEER